MPVYEWGDALVRVRVWIGMILGALTMVCAPIAPVAASSRSTVPPTTAALSDKTLESIVPHGVKIGSHLLLKEGSQYKVVIVTNPGEFSAQPGWIVVGNWNPNSQQWELQWLHRAFGDNTPYIVDGPAYGENHAVALVYGDGATAFYETIDVLNVSPQSVNLMRSIPTLESGSVVRKRGTLVISGAYSEEIDQWSASGLWVHHQLSEKQILNRANVHILYAQEVNEENGKPVTSMVIIGNTIVHAKAKQTLAFIPANNSAWASFSNTQIYSNSGTRSIQFGMASLLRGNVTQLWNPGVYKFAIAPPGDYSFSVDKRMAVVKVIVTK